MLPTNNNPKTIVETNYRPPISFSKEKDTHGYPMVQYLVRDKLGQTAEKSETSNPYDAINSIDKSITYSPTPISKIDKNTTPAEFFQQCKKYPDYQLNHADFSSMTLTLKTPLTAPDSTYLAVKTPLTALAMAVFMGNEKLVDAIIKTVPDKKIRQLFVNQRMFLGYTAAFFVNTDKQEPSKAMKILQMLTQAGANLELSSWTSCNITPLSMAIDTGDHLAAQNLILQGVQLPKFYTPRVFCIDMLGLKQINLIRNLKLHPPPTVKIEFLNQLVSQIILSKNNEKFPSTIANSFLERFQEATVRIKEIHKIILLIRHQQEPNLSIFNHQDIFKKITSIFMTISCPTKYWLLNLDHSLTKHTKDEWFSKTTLKAEITLWPSSG